MKWLTPNVRRGLAILCLILGLFISTMFGVLCGVPAAGWFLLVWSCGALGSWVLVTETRIQDRDAWLHDLTQARKDLGPAYGCTACASHPNGVCDRHA